MIVTGKYDYDFVIIGSGFGGSVSALRLSEKGYKVLVIEKGKWFQKSDDFPKTNWNVRKYFWLPALGFKGLLKLSFFRHVAVLSGVGVGGGSLVYANTLPVPKKEFYESGHWKGLADWENELKPFYDIAKKMLGANLHPYMSRSDKVMQQLASEISGKESFSKTEVAVYFGTPGVKVPDPYFDGKGPDRTGCILCGGCMLGCRYNSKNTLDKNYLYLARQLGAEIMAEQEVVDVIPLSPDGNEGYEIVYKASTGWYSKKKKIRSRGVIFAGGVMGTVPLLLRLKEESLPNLSAKVGYGVRTNSESLIGVTTFRRDADYSEGIAIGSIIEIDSSRHLEPVKYSAGSGVWRLLMAPMVKGKYWYNRLAAMLKDLLIHPVENLKTFLVDDWSKRTMILLYMESIDSTLRMVKSGFGGMSSKTDQGAPPTAFNPKAQELARKVEMIIDGKAMVMNTETLLGIPTTAHILGGACMGESAATGVIDSQNRVFNYQNMYVCDGSMISANPGVNPSLTITAITERAMSKIPVKTP
ncbi:MAG: GMC family oxidoreductase [Saprospiraceae bacterium]|nr:GMC family oxidoreductase [Saprospiraceae bacterium]